MLTSEKITLIITAWIILMFNITGDADLEIFFTLIFIGILIIKILSDLYTTKNFKLRMNAIISVFLIIYIVIITQKIMNILNISTG